MNVMDDVMWIVRRATKFDSESRDDNFCQEVVPHVSGLRSSSSGSKSSFGSGESRNRHSSESKVDMSSATRIEIIYVRSRYPLRSKVRYRDVSDADLKDIG
jgi:hypothetical protein